MSLFRVCDVIFNVTQDLTSEVKRLRAKYVANLEEEKAPPEAEKLEKVKVVR